MNWGKGIAIFLTIFVLFILGLIYMTTQSTFDLEVEDYYAQEIGYQGRIDALKVGADYKEVIRVESAADQVVVTMDANQNKAFEKGKISFYRPNDSALDRNYDLQFTDGTATFPNTEFVKGKYEVRIEWEVQGVAHAMVQDLIVG